MRVVREQQLRGDGAMWTHTWGARRVCRGGDGFSGGAPAGRAVTATPGAGLEERVDALEHDKRMMQLDLHLEARRSAR